MLILCDDLFFRVKLGELAWKCGTEAVAVWTRDAFEDWLAPRAPLPAIAIVDLKLEAFPPLEAIQLLRSMYPGLTIVAFGPHVDRADLRSAELAGATHPLPRSRLVRELPGLLRSLVATSGERV